VKGRVVSKSKIERLLAGWQHASQSEQNARDPQSMRDQPATKEQSEGEREHVARPSRHVAGLF
jgi:hypothetical protein